MLKITRNKIIKTKLHSNYAFQIKDIVYQEYMFLFLENFSMFFFIPSVSRGGSGDAFNGDDAESACCSSELSGTPANTGPGGRNPNCCPVAIARKPRAIASSAACCLFSAT